MPKDFIWIDEDAGLKYKIEPDGEPAYNGGRLEPSYEARAWVNRIWIASDYQSVNETNWVEIPTSAFRPRTLEYLNEMCFDQLFPEDDE